MPKLQPAVIDRYRERAKSSFPAREGIFEGGQMLSHHRNHKRLVGLALATLVSLGAHRAWAQSEAEQIGAVLGEEIISPGVSLFQLKQYLLKRIAPPPAPSSAAQWNKEAKQLRERLLATVFHGWPKEWVTAPPKFEDLGLVESGKGYRTRKLRYEIIPGFQSAAILYEPENLTNKVPAILNVNGHVGAPGKSVEYKQKRCINFAKRGIMALNLEWLSFGELTGKENEHWFGAHLDLVGTPERGPQPIGSHGSLRRRVADDHPEFSRRTGHRGCASGRIFFAGPAHRGP